MQLNTVEDYFPLVGDSRPLWLGAGHVVGNFQFYSESVLLYLGRQDKIKINLILDYKLVSIFNFRILDFFFIFKRIFMN